MVLSGGPSGNQGCPLNWHQNAQPEKAKRPHGAKTARCGDCMWSPNAAVKQEMHFYSGYRKPHKRVYDEHEHCQGTVNFKESNMLHFFPLCAISQGFSVPYQFLLPEQVEFMQFSGLRSRERAPPWIPFSSSLQWLSSETLYVLDYPFSCNWWNFILCNGWVIILLKIYKPAFLLIKYPCSATDLGRPCPSFCLHSWKPTELTLLPGLSRPPWEDALYLHERYKSCAWALLVFHVTQEILLSLSLFFSLSFCRLWPTRYRSVLKTNRPWAWGNQSDTGGTLIQWTWLNTNWKMGHREGNPGKRAWSAASCVCVCQTHAHVRPQTW